MMIPGQALTVLFSRLLQADAPPDMQRQSLEDATQSTEATFFDILDIKSSLSLTAVDSFDMSETETEN